MEKQMTRSEREYQELKDMLLNLKAMSDMKILMSEDRRFIYAYVITERDTVLSVSTDHFWGYRVSYLYKPSRRYGTGCSCATPNGEEAIEYINTPEELEALERSGIAFADRFGVTHYQNSNEFLDELHNKDELIEL